MRKVITATCLASCLGIGAVWTAGAAYANDELIKMQQNPKDWVMPTGNYANHRYSQLKQINADNVGKLQVAWTFSTGVLRGHEGGPLWDRRHDVSSYAVPKYRLRDEPEGREQDRLEV